MAKPITKTLDRLKPLLGVNSQVLRRAARQLVGLLQDGGFVDQCSTVDKSGIKVFPLLLGMKRPDGQLARIRKKPHPTFIGKRLFDQPRHEAL